MYQFRLYFYFIQSLRFHGKTLLSPQSGLVWPPPYFVDILVLTIGIYPQIWLWGFVFLGGGFKYLYVHPYFGKIPILTSKFFKGVGSTTN